MPQQKSLTVTSLNVGRFLQDRTRAYIQSLGNTEALPDVLCLQDIPFRDLSLLEQFPHIAFGPMANHLINGERAVVGIAMLSRYPMTDIVYHTTWGDGKLKDLQGVDNKNQRITPTTENDRLVESTEDRVVICANIIKDDIEYGMVTTHGQWVRGGVTNDVQRQSTRSLIHFVLAQAGRRNGIVLVGDMNFGRNSEIYKMFIDKKFRDCVPLEIDNTLDPEHPAVRKGIRVVRDYFMICEGYGGDFVSYDLHEVSEVILRPGVSDHCALSATISMVPA